VQVAVSQRPIFDHPVVPKSTGFSPMHRVIRIGLCITCCRGFACAIDVIACARNQDYCGEDQQHDPNTSLLAVRNSPRRAAQAGPGNPIVSRMPLRPMQASLVKATSIIAGYNAAACPAPVRDRPPELIERMAWSSAKHPRMLNGRSPRV
jgi:hypothetical protein